MLRTDAEIEAILAAFDETVPDAPQAQRKEFERKLREEKQGTPEDYAECFLLAAEQSGFGFWDYDLHTHRMIRSKGWYQLRGRPCNQTISLLQGDWKNYVHPDDLEKVQTEVNAILEGGAPFIAVTYRTRHATKGWVNIRVVGVVTRRDENGRPLWVTGFDRDGTREILLERQIGEKQALLREMLGVTRAGFLVFDLGTETMEHLGGMESVFGDEVFDRIDIRKFIKQWIFSEDQPVFWDRFLKFLSEAEHQNFECRMVDGTGKIHQTRYHARVIRREDGQIGKINVVVLDESDRFEREAELRSNRNRFRMLFERSGDAMILLEDDRIVEFNYRAAELFAVADREAFHGRMPADLAPETQPDGVPSRKKLRDLMEHATFADPAHPVVMRMKLASGREFDAEVSLFKMPSLDDPLRLMVLKDLSDERIAARRLENYRAYLSVLDAMRKTFYSRDEREIIKSFLVNVVTFFGFAKGWYGEVIGDNVVPVDHAGPSKRVVDVMQLPVRAEAGTPEFPLLTALRRGGPLVLDALPRNPGFAPWLDFVDRTGVNGFFAMPLEVDETTPGGFVFYSDEEGVFDASMVDYLQNAIRELGSTVSMKRFEARQRQTLREARDDAEFATELKSQFLATMSHEIRTPMTAILGYAELLDDPTASVELRQKAVDVIRRSGDHLLKILNDILDFSKIGAGKLDIELTPVSLPLLLDDVARLYAKKAEEKGITFTISATTPIPETIRTDPVRVRQILLNLVSNAVKFTDRGGVSVAVSWRDDDSGAPVAGVHSGRLTIDVTDTGPGLSVKSLATLFEPFQQADGSTTRRFGGTGLGLTIARHLVELLDGTITVDTEPGKGTTFTVSFAQKPKSDVRWVRFPEVEFETTTPPPEERRPLHGRRILLAEDDKAGRRLFQLLLDKAGAETVPVENGLLALETYRQSVEDRQEFDLVLMDLQMPVMDGYRATRELREAGFRGPILALSAHVMQDRINRCFEAGCDDYVFKPVLREKLLEAVLRNLDRAGDDYGD